MWLDHKIELLDEAKDALDFVCDYRTKYGDWPTCAIVEEELKIPLPDEEESLDYLIEKVRKRTLGISLEKNLQRVVERLEKREPDEALSEILAVVREYRVDAGRSKVVSHRKSADDRIAYYDEVKKSGGMLGIETPWPALNKNIQGWVNNTLNIIAGVAGCGKTWSLCICAEHALKQNKKVLFITLEMDIFRIQRRIDALRHKIPFRELRNCSLDAEGEARWKELLKTDVVGEGDILFADKSSVRTIEEIEALVYDVKPDIVFIDGVYRIDAQGARFRGQWESSLKIVNSLQLAAEMTGIPWIGTTQLNDPAEGGKLKKGRKKISGWNVRYAKEYLINPCVVIGLYTNEDLRLLKMLEVYLLKIRESTGDAFVDFSIHWDLDKMDFSEISGFVEESGMPGYSVTL